jgi:flagellar biosynthesis regulator FlaF
MSRLISGSEPFRACLALDYYDGPTEGLLFDKDESAFYFKLVAWDSSLDQRVFAVTKIERQQADDIWNSCEALETPRLPIWAPRLDLNDSIELSTLVRDLRGAIVSQTLWMLYEAYDLTHGALKRATLLEPEATRLTPLLTSSAPRSLSSPRLLEEFLDTL